MKKIIDFKSLPRNTPQPEVVAILGAQPNEHVEFHCREHSVHINGHMYIVVAQDDGRLFMCGLANKLIEQTIPKESALHIPMGWVLNPSQFNGRLTCLHDACPVHPYAKKGSKVGHAVPRKKLGA